MTRRSFLVVVATSVTVGLKAGPVQAARTSDGDGLRAFHRALDAYMTLRRRLEQDVPPLRTSGNVREIREAVDARRAAVRRARAQAQRGDMFNAEVASLFRMRIQQILLANDDLVAELMHEMSEDGGGWSAAVVNGEFSWSTAAATPPPVLAALHPLPDELQYRFVGHDLVLVDVDASVVLDILPGVIVGAPPARERRPVKRGRYREAHVGGDWTTLGPVGFARRGRSSP
jgi:hypothetical protein